VGLARDSIESHQIKLYNEIWVISSVYAPFDPYLLCTVVS
jgi:hypothetical protein